MVSGLSILFMVVSLVISFALPIGLCIWFYKAKHADLMPFFVGCAVMILFAFVLEQFAHRVILSSAAGEKILGTAWLYALYGGIMAGVFEETGRFLAFRTVLRGRRKKNANALMYGAGHGGIEAVIILGITSINNLIYSVLINTGNTSVLTASLTGNARLQVEQAIRALTETPSWQFLLGGVERIFAVILQIALSVLVWFAAKDRRVRILFPAAICIHFLVDSAAAMLSKNGISVMIIESVIGIMTIVAAICACSVLVWLAIAKRFSQQH